MDVMRVAKSFVPGFLETLNDSLRICLGIVVHVMDEDNAMVNHVNANALDLFLRW